MKLFLDPYAIIYWVEMSGPPYTYFVEQLQSVRREYGALSFAASHLSLLECRVKALKDQNETLLKHYQEFFCSSDLSLIPISPEVLQKAAELQAFHSFHTANALQAASALSIEEEIIFVTGDAAFKKVPALQCLLISE